MTHAAAVPYQQTVCAVCGTSLSCCFCARPDDFRMGCIPKMSFDFLPAAPKVIKKKIEDREIADSTCINVNIFS